MLDSIFFCKDGVSKYLLVHRVVAEAFLKKENSNFSIVDHIDKNIKNNYFGNLRWCFPSTNIRNTKRKSSSIYIGVYWSNENKNWYSQIRYNYKSIALGRFKSEIEAAKAYDQALIDYNITDRDPNFKN